MDPEAFLKHGGPPATKLEGITDRLLVALAASPYLTTVSSLDLTGGRLRTRGLQALAASPGARALRSLCLSQCHVGDEALIALATSPNLSALQTLDLGWNEFGGSSWRRLTRSQALTGLQVLRAASNPLGPAGWKALLASPLAPQLRALDLTMTRPGAAGLRDLLSSDLPELRVLDVACVGLRVETLARHPSWPALERLTHLGVGNNALHPEGLAKLLDAGGLSQIESLDLGATSIDRRHGRPVEWVDDGFAVLARAQLPRLRVLGLRGLSLSAATAHLLSTSPVLRNVEDLSLGGAGVDASLATLLASSTLERLTCLRLDAGMLGDRGALALVDAKHLPALTYLDVRRNRIGPEAVAALQARWGDRVRVPPPFMQPGG